ncbi:MAG UNVERIFIED_CONTAM: BldC family transcriptional regulator [Thermobifida fusca]
MTNFEDLMTPAEVAQAFHVDPKTVTRWARAGRLRSVRTPGGHRRYFRSEVEALLLGAVPDAEAAEQEQEPAS